MTHFNRRVMALAFGLAVLAAYIDAVGLKILLHSTIFGATGADGQARSTLVQGIRMIGVPVALAGAFIVGVVGGSLAGTFASARSRLASLALVAVLLAIAAGFSAANLPIAAVLGEVLAVGAANSVFQREGNLHVGLLFLVEILVRLGEGVATAIAGREQTAWVGPLFFFVASLLGAFLGWNAFDLLGARSLWAATSAAAALALLSSIVGTGGPPSASRSGPTG